MSWNGLTVLAVVPARGGSKGIPRKNLARLPSGMSLLEWTIDQALRCFGRDEVLVSTEDAEMAAVAAGRGAQIVSRPADLAQDHSTTASVVADLLARIDPGAGRYDTVAILQVTSPLRRDEDVARARALLESGRFDSVVSAFEVTDTHPAKMYYLDGDVAYPVSPEYETARRQDLPRVFRRNGAIFMTTRARFAATGTLWGGRTGLVVMPRERSIDIDGPDDLEAARRFLQTIATG
jgi:CMP-N,N'-diacetyllegionaminic acid synthase